MAYADQKQNKAVAIGSALAIQTAIGAALFTGLVVTTSTGTKPKPPIDIYDVPLPPPPPPEPEPLREVVKPIEQATPPIHVPVPPIPTRSEVEIATTTVITPVLPPLPGPVTSEPVLPVAEPPPPAVNLSRLVKPRGNVAGWFPQDSYPPAARRAGAEGRVSVSLQVGADGRVAGCSITASSGNGDLDAATCRLATRNGRFAPALNGEGQAVASTVTLPPVRWRLEE